MQPEFRDDGPIFDILGVGFGPSNLSLAAAIDEHNSTVPSTPLRAVFVERKRSFGWHEGMLLDQATMQVSFLKDLAAMRNPRSRFTFLTYLHERGRLVDFVNHKTLFPLRIEFHDYLEWVAGQFTDLVHYGDEVVDVRPVEADGKIAWLDVVSRDVDDPTVEVVRRTRNLVIASGLVPFLPPGVERTDRIWHSSEFLDRAAELNAAPATCTVIGAGQSAAEIAGYLHEKFPQAHVHAVFSRYGYSPADDSPFANRVFDPAAVDEFFAAPAHVQQKFFQYHANTNYSVVDLELIQDLYARVYRESVRGEPRLHMHHMTEVETAASETGRVRLRLKRLTSGERVDLDTDLVIYATGYRPMDPLGVLGSVAGLCKHDASGRLRVQRDHQVVTEGSVECGIYVQGGTEHTHGLSSSLLSTTAVRAGEIVRSILDREPRGTTPRCSNTL
ncbi:lysine N(6)-hydroxylase/L-ornithine N(5)-oxygenase family protein [Streptomyces sp. NPDC096136]|uniref:lysine N(6)-hydroxylase/L-ornithine N(5)-oxygenase family protein n=1 Tax=Streptomyces sp. NPDC096136 TaxID=3366076 RepID=UPI0037F8A5D7